MAKCEVCGNEYSRVLRITQDGVTHSFDSFECAIHLLAPKCGHCDCKVIGHGVEANGVVYCCAHCAHAKGAVRIADNEAHAVPT